MGGTLSASGASVTVTSVSSDNAQFATSGLTFPLTISAGGSVPFNAVFAPTSSGTATASLSFVSNATTSPTVQALSGTGVNASHEVGLKWDASTSEVSGYNIYRGTISGGPYSKINSALDASTIYVDTSVSGETTYYYVTTAVDSGGTESSYSNEVQAAIP